MSTTSTFTSHHNRPTVRLSPRIYEWQGGEWGFGLEHIDDRDDMGPAGKPISAEAAERYRFNPMPPKTPC